MVRFYLSTFDATVYNKKYQLKRRVNMDEDNNQGNGMNNNTPEEQQTGAPLQGNDQDNGQNNQGDQKQDGQDTNDQGQDDQEDDEENTPVV